MAASTVSVDEFQALEQKVLQTVELIKREREMRSNAEAERDAALAELAELRDRLQAQNESAGAAEAAARAEVEDLQRERETVRQRVEKMLAQMDALL